MKDRTLFTQTERLWYVCRATDPGEWREIRLEERQEGRETTNKQTKKNITERRKAVK
jgi:hypothetical protein